MSLDDNRTCMHEERVRILGIPVDVISMTRAVDKVCQWAGESPHRTVFVREVASLMAARDELKLKALHETADLIVPDGMPLVWIGRLRGYGAAMDRVSGADLVDAVCARSVQSGQSHYFFGGKSGVAETMAEKLGEKYPGLRIAGTYSPPMRLIGPDYAPDAAALAEIAAIKATNPDFVWVGLSSPKQEYWMMQAAPLIGHGVFFGVGAAFDFHSGAVLRAPLWMQRNGLEWLHRLASQPSRLWHRYLVLAPRFVWLAMQEEIFQRAMQRRPGRLS
jgi:N-acetylglucosaminyldiphosphoundecaprenol N-acetyl-beta-D-mannosaminyltransferase